MATAIPKRLWRHLSLFNLWLNKQESPATSVPRLKHKHTPDTHQWFSGKEMRAEGRSAGSQADLSTNQSLISINCCNFHISILVKQKWREVLLSVTVDETVSECVRVVLRAIYTCTDHLINYDGILGNKKCASLNDISLNRWFWLQKQNFLLSLTTTGFSYNMLDPIGETNKTNQEL